RQSFGNAAGGLAGRDRYRTGIEHIVAPGASANPRVAEPMVDLGKPVPLQQPEAECVALLRFLRRQRPAAVQPQEHQFGMHLAHIELAMRTDEGVDLHDLGSEMPELARDARLPSSLRFAIGLVGIGKFLPEPAPRAGEDARGMRTQLVAREEVAGTLTVLRHADGDV